MAKALPQHRPRRVPHAEDQAAEAEEQVSVGPTNRATGPRARAYPKAEETTAIETAVPPAKSRREITPSVRVVAAPTTSSPTIAEPPTP